MNCEPNCNWLEFDEGYWCNRWNLQLYGNPPQRVSECKEEAVENERINKREAVNEDLRLFGRRSQER